MTDKRNLKDSELEKIAGAGDPNQDPSFRLNTVDERRPKAVGPISGGGGGAGHPELEEQDSPSTTGDQNIQPV